MKNAWGTLSFPPPIFGNRSVGGGGECAEHPELCVCFLSPPAPQFQFEIKFNFSFLNSDWNEKHHCMYFVNVPDDLTGSNYLLLCKYFAINLDSIVRPYKIRRVLLTKGKKIDG